LLLILNLLILNIFTVVLSDPNTRAIYDTVGVRGLDFESNRLDIALRTKNPGEVLQAYEKLKLEKEESKQLQKANPKGTFGVNINATDLFNSYPTDIEGFVFIYY
jgi:DnaJ family protein C protein 11